MNTPPLTTADLQQPLAATTSTQSKPSLIVSLLSVLLLASVAGNVYLYVNQQKQSDATPVITTPTLTTTATPEATAELTPTTEEPLEDFITVTGPSNAYVVSYPQFYYYDDITDRSTNFIIYSSDPKKTDRFSYANFNIEKDTTLAAAKAELKEFYQEAQFIDTNIGTYTAVEVKNTPVPSTVYERYYVIQFGNDVVEMRLTEEHPNGANLTFDLPVAEEILKSLQIN